MSKPIIKNIFWDVDGVLANLNFAYFNFLTKHPKYAQLYRTIKWTDLPKVLPLNKQYGALDLKTHPTMGNQMDKDFCNSPEFFNNRPLYEGVITTIKELHKLGYRQFTMSATYNVESKTKLLKFLLSEIADCITIECVQHGEYMHDTAKEDALKKCFKKYNLKAEETILVDDRTYNQYAAINVGAHPVRMCCEFTTDLPENLKWIPQVKSVPDFQDWLLKNTRLK